MSETLVTSSNVGFQIIFFLHFYNENIWQQTYSRFQSVKEADCVMPSFVLHVNNLSLEQNIGISRTSVVFNTVAPSSSSSVSPVRAEDDNIVLSLAHILKFFARSITHLALLI